MQCIKQEVVGVIPARMNSSRLPGKMLCKILGKSLIQRTYERSTASSSLDKLYVATDNESIACHVRGFGGNVVMTSSFPQTGTERVAEAVEAHFPSADIIVNIQGDEPCIKASTIDAVVNKLLSSDGQMSTAVTPFQNQETANDPSIVKCVFTESGQALYFSRSPIPYHLNGEEVYYRHLGIYCFLRPFLLKLPHLLKTPLQKAEDLEQLLILEAGYKIVVAKVQDLGIGVDTQEDIKKVEQFLCASTSSSQEA